MDLETELDYEEEDVKRSDDEYLRIDLSEEEENFFSGEKPVEKESAKNQNIRKVNKKAEGSHQENTSSEKEQCKQTNKQNNSLDESNGDSQGIAVPNVQKKMCQLQSQFNNNRTKPQCVSHSLGEEKLAVGQDVVKSPVLPVLNSHRLSLSQGFSSNQNTAIQPLLTLKTFTPEEELKSKRFRPLQTFDSNSSSRFPVSSHTLSQQGNEPAISCPAWSINNNQPKFQNNERKNFYRNPAFKDDQPKVMLKDECLKRTENLPKPKPEISKELLLKKRNPFDIKVELPDYTPAVKVKEEHVDGRLFNPDVVHRRLKEEQQEEEAGRSLSVSNSSCQGFYAVKADSESHVKFVRTVSKSFDELTQKNGYSSPVSQLRTFPFAQGSLKRNSPSKDPPQVRYRVLSRIF